MVQVKKDLIQFLLRIRILEKNKTHFLHNNYKALHLEGFCIILTISFWQPDILRIFLYKTVNFASSYEISNNSIHHNRHIFSVFFFVKSAKEQRLRVQVPYGWAVLR